VSTIRILWKWLPATGLAAGLAIAFLPSCSGCDLPLLGQSHVFDAPVPTACRTVTVPKKIDVNRAADILFVIDNSGSMAEEQENLAANASSYAQGGACDLAINPNAVSELKTYISTGPARGVPAESWISSGIAMAAEMKARYDDCGFIERLQLFDNDFQIGIITTDRRDMEGLDRGGGNFSCLNPQGFPNGRSALPQRGCLMPVPGSASKIIRPTSGNTAQISQQFRDAVRNVGVCSSGLEEGLQNIKEFLTPDAGRAQASCGADFQQFLRGPDCQRGPDGGVCLTDNNGQPIPGAERKLVVIILSDEEDCSSTNDPAGGPQTSNLASSSLCYTAQQFLKPTSEFVGFLRTRKTNPDLVALAAIVGGSKDDNGVFSPGNCRCNGDSANAPPLLQCAEVNGNSINVARCGAPQANQFCGSLPSGNLPDGGALTLPCCTADTGSRYVNVASLMPNFILDSICSQTYKSTMIDIADLINQNDVVPLGERPQDIRQLLVEVKKGEGAEYVTIRPWTGDRDDPRFTACNGCTGNAGECDDGFALTNNCTQVKFLGADVPPQGAEIRVSYLGPAAPGAPRCQ
jgi:hypothetical protein